MNERFVSFVRHAKSSWGDEALGDHERPLNGRGRRVAPGMGAWLVEQGPPVDLWITSSARRARETTELMRDAAGSEAPIEVREELYHASPDALVAAVQTLDASCAHAAVVAHNPGMEILASQLAGRIEPFPTCAIARVRGDFEAWAAFDPKGVELLGVARPKSVLGDRG